MRVHLRNPFLLKKAAFNDVKKAWNLFYRGNGYIKCRKSYVFDAIAKIIHFF